MELVPGRELLGQHLPIHGRGLQLVKAILVQLGFHKASKLRKTWFGATVAVICAMQLGRWRRKSDSSPPEVRVESCRRKRFTDLLQTAGRFAAGTMDRPEIVVLFVASGLNAWLMLYKAWLMREFVTGQNLGRWKEWFKALAKFPFAILASALLSQTTKYVQARVSMLWRKTATCSLLRSYFSNMNYYKLLHHGSARIEDVDVRICSDVRSGCDALTGVLISGLSGVMMASFSTWALYQRRGLSAVFLPYIYSFIIVPLSYRLTSPDWSVSRLVQKANAAYQQALTRVEQAGETALHCFCGLNLRSRYGSKLRHRASDPGGLRPLRCGQKKCMRLLGMNPTEKEVQMAMESVDENKNGKLEFEEFRTLMEPRLSEWLQNDQVAILTDCFKVFDTEGNGKISKEMLGHIMTSQGDKLNDAELDRMMKAADADGDGMIDYKEFVINHFFGPNSKVSTGSWGSETLSWVGSVPGQISNAYTAAAESVNAAVSNGPGVGEMSN
eukprot:s1115_g12.t1